MKRRTFNASLVSSVVIPRLVTAAPAEDAAGVSGDSIKIGNIVPYSGPAAAYSVLGKGFAAYFDKINAEGGINGRKIEFISRDDEYNPTKTLAVTRELVERDKVFAMFGVLGSPTNAAIMRYLNQRKVPQIFPGTGASMFDNPKEFPYTQSWQPTYAVEADMFVQDILEKNPDARIAVLFQNDDFGQDYFEGLEQALESRDASVQMVKSESYETTEPSIASQIANLQASGADTYINVATPKFAAQAIKEIARIGWRPVHYLPSIANYVESVIKPAGEKNAEGIITSFYLKDPTDPQWVDTPEYGEWLHWMRTYYPSGDITNNLNVYSYCIVQTFAQLLKQSGNPPTRSGMVEQLAHLDLDLPMLLPGIRIHTSAKERLPVNEERFAVWSGGAWHLR